MNVQHSNIIIQQNQQIISLLSQLVGTSPAMQPVIDLKQQPEPLNLITVSKKKKWNREERKFAYSIFPGLPHIQYLKTQTA